jgi:hypothetical protein
MRAEVVVPALARIGARRSTSLTLTWRKRPGLKAIDRLAVAAGSVLRAGPILLCMGLFSRFCVQALRRTAEQAPRRGFPSTTAKDDNGCRRATIVAWPQHSLKI